MNGPTHEVVGGRPPVIKWFHIYCIVLSVIYLISAIVVPMIFLMDPDMPPLVARLLGGGMAVLCLVLLAACAAPLFLPARPWVWVYDLVIICLGMSSACFLPVCVPLLIYWLKPEVKAHFGRPAA